RHASPIRVAGAAGGRRGARLPAAEAIQSAPRAVLASEHRAGLPAATRAGAPWPGRPPGRRDRRPAAPALSADGPRRARAAYLAGAPAGVAPAAARRDLRALPRRGARRAARAAGAARAPGGGGPALPRAGDRGGGAPDAVGDATAGTRGRAQPRGGAPALARTLPRAAAPGRLAAARSGGQQRGERRRQPRGRVDARS